MPSSQQKKEREILTSAIGVLRRKSKDREVAADILQDILEDDSRLSVAGRVNIARAAANKWADHRARKRGTKVVPTGNKVVPMRKAG